MKVIDRDNIWGVAVSDKAAKASFSESNYRALESGEPHSLTFREIVDAADGVFPTQAEAVRFLREHGGGWTFDSALESYWTGADEQ